MKVQRPLALGSCLLLYAGAVLAQLQVSLRSGESTDLLPVYWIANCKSTLEKFVGADVLEGPPEIQVSIREEPVTARRQGCAEKVPGGTLVMTAGSITEKKSATVRIRVNYQTQDGRKQSNHSVKVDLIP